MVSLRRVISSKLWTVRRSKSIFILFVLIATVLARILIQAGVRLFDEDSSLPSDSHLGLQGNVLTQKNYKLTWLGDKDDSYYKSNSKIDEKQRTHIKAKTNSVSETNSHVSKSRQKRRTFIFVFRYYEQLGRATSNLLALASWARFRNGFFVAPFVNNSRMSGLPGGVSHFLRESKTPKFGPLSTYYNIPKLEETFKQHGYGSVATLNEFENECNRRLHIVVHFLYPTSDDLRDAAGWYRRSYKEMRDIYSQTEANGGWLDCPFVRFSRLQKQIRFKISRFVCVDPNIIRTPWELEEKVIQGRQCVGVVRWKGTGKDRTHFPIHPSISHPLSPSDLPFNSNLLETASNFVKNVISSKFIAIHVRIERHYVRMGMNVTYRCMKKLIRRVLEARKRFKTAKLFLASDLPEYGSDTFKEQSPTRKDREILLSYLIKHLDYPIMYKPTDIYDTGTIAIVEMNILAAGAKLYTLGGGNFQEWILKLFLKNPSKSRRDVHRLCELT